MPLVPVDEQVILYRLITEQNEAVIKARFEEEMAAGPGKSDATNKRQDAEKRLNALKTKRRNLGE